MTSSVFTYNGADSYGSFLAPQKNLDGFSLLVDLHMAQSLSTQTRLAEQGLQAMNDMSGQVMSLRGDIQEVNSSIQEMSSVMQHGFYQVSLELNDIKGTLAQLLKVAKTPDQTWAMEQYSIASQAYKRGHFEEALDYVNRAIDGHGERSGFRLEYRFHFLRGLIRLGGPGHADMNIVNPEVAIKDFLNAAKYASHLKDKVQSRCYAMAGWACYCAGRMEDARTYLEKALTLNQRNYSAKYDYAKLLYHEGDTETAGDQFYHALIGDWKYGLRAASDEDFLKHKAAVQDVIEHRRRELVNDIKRVKVNFTRLEYEKRLKIASQYDVNMSPEPVEHFNELVGFEDEPIDRLLEIDQGAEVINQEAQRIINAARDQLQAKAGESKANAKRTTSGIWSSTPIIAIKAGAAVLLLTWIVTWILDGFFAALFYGTILGGVLGIGTAFVTAVVIMPLIAGATAMTVHAKANQTAVSAG